MRFLTRVDWHEGFVRIMSTPFQWPWRLTLGIWISFIGATILAFAGVFYVYNIYRVIGWLKDLKRALELDDDEEIVFEFIGILDNA